jgi:hypothetical protein
MNKFGVAFTDLLIEKAGGKPTREFLQKNTEFLLLISKLDEIMKEAAQAGIPEEVISLAYNEYYVEYIHSL